MADSDADDLSSSNGQVDESIKMPLWEPVLFVCSLENCSFASMVHDGLVVEGHLSKAHNLSLENIHQTLPFFSKYLESVMLRFECNPSLRSVGSPFDKEDASLRRSLRLSALVWLHWWHCLAKEI